jgi:DNA-binding CsgD family transcriptional regulator
LVADQSLIRRQMQQIAEILNHEDRHLDADRNDNAASRTPFLTDFENLCLGFMAEGYTPIRISHASDRSVEEILAVENIIIRKFGSSNRFQAVAKAVLLGLIGD